MPAAVEPCSDDLTIIFSTAINRGDTMTEQLTEIEQKLIEFATKTAETIQNQAGQIQAMSHVLLIALVSLSEQNPGFKSDFIERIRQIRDQLDDQAVDKYTRDYFDELVRFLDDPYNYSNSEDGRPRWFKGIISGGKEPSPSSDDET